MADLRNPIDVILGARVRMLRDRRGLSLSALALRIGANRRRMQTYESGDTRMSASTLLKITQALDLDISDILCVLTPPSVRH